MAENEMARVGRHIELIGRMRHTSFDPAMAGLVALGALRTDVPREKPEEVIKDLDVVAEAGGPFRTLVKQFPDVRPRRRDAIELTFTAKAGEPLICGAELIQTE